MHGNEEDVSASTTEDWCEGSSQWNEKTFFLFSSFQPRAHPPGRKDKRVFRVTLLGKQSGVQGVIQNIWFIVFQC